MPAYLRRGVYIMRKYLNVLGSCLAALILSMSATAQTQTTGTVEGTVTDPNGAVVPAITVNLSGPNLIRPQTTVTDADGYFRFSSVPPGRYTIDVAAAKGFNAYKNDNVEV